MRERLGDGVRQRLRYVCDREAGIAELAANSAGTLCGPWLL
jgi:hypothetical protein